MIFLATSDGWLDIGDRRVRAALGPAGVISAGAKREGDLASPAGVWPIREVIYRPDRGPPPATEIRVRAMAEDDGWCDDPSDPAYNRPVKLPYRASAERMWRDDHLYDLVVVLGHNDDPVVPGLGSATFLHLAKPDYAPTHGCVAVARDDLEELLDKARPGDAVGIRP
ncbi:L,D-transpeptidase family protein [Phenylobacterium sp.]|uniref:L,D-transpeptidase family protein n=1 Tax=Phenylobacterium sp. TaxID=1871053 RepID=UPI0025D74982|nr:L,D-transpeptidase family protein [Phenylobacterium sp.]MBX3482924.1 L,D-transpeptidase family protein [Phenylobacterium sp.]MCW5759165.1 L,D-transpeptidase family protein [Phenylobacterium sp.]